MPDSKM